MKYVINIIMVMAALLMIIFLISLQNSASTISGKGYVFPILVVLSIGGLHIMLRRFLFPLHNIPENDRERVKSIISSVERKGVFTVITYFGYLGLFSFAFMYMTGDEHLGKGDFIDMIYGSIQFIAIGFAGNLRRIILRLIPQSNETITQKKDSDKGNSPDLPRRTVEY